MAYSTHKPEHEAPAMSDNQKEASDILSVPSLHSLPPETVPLPAPTEDGGTRAWLQVIGSFLVFANLWGFVFAYGAFQSFYQLQFLPASSPSDISWVGTVAGWLLIVVGVVSGPLFDQGHFRAMLYAGAFIETLSVFLLSVCQQGKYWQVMLTQGVLMGLGNGLLFLPGLALVGRSFEKHRAIAMAVVSCGAPVGGIIYTIVFERLITDVDFGWTVRAMAFVMLATYLISFPLLLWRVENLGDLAVRTGQKRKLFDVTALQDLPFWAYSMSNVGVFLGYLVPFFYLGIYGQEELGLSRSFSLYVIIISQATSTVGRLAAGWAATKTGVLGPWAASAFLSGVICIAWAGVKNKVTFVVIGALYGFFSGPLIPLPPSIFPVVCPYPEMLGTRLGMAQAINSIATLIGSPIAGALITSNGSTNNYLSLQLFGGVSMSFAAVIIGGLGALLRRRDGK